MKEPESWKLAQREVDMGIAVRQSAESKQSRVDVLRSNARQLEDAIRQLAKPPEQKEAEAEFYSGDTGTVSVVEEKGR